MELTGTKRQQHFIELAAAHAEDFKTRVAQHDRENSFPFENVEAMKASGYTNMTVPAELGGGGRQRLGLELGAGAIGPRRWAYRRCRQHAPARRRNLR